MGNVKPLGIKRPKPLTPKQKRFAKDFVLTGNATEAARKNYGVTSTASASEMGWKNLQKPHVLEAIDKEKKRLGDLIPDSLVVDRHIELLNKRETVQNLVEGKMVLENTPDTHAVGKGLEMAYRLKGAYAPEETKSINVNISLSELIRLAKQNVLPDEKKTKETPEIDVQ